jgi:hypothetical protein
MLHVVSVLRETVENILAVFLAILTRFVVPDAAAILNTTLLTAPVVLCLSATNVVAPAILAVIPNPLVIDIKLVEPSNVTHGNPFCLFKL